MQILTPQMLATFIGGQIEIQNEGEDYIFRGQIRTAEVVDGNFKVTLNWNAKGEGFPPLGWNVENNLDYEASLEIFSVSDIGPSPDGGDSRICLDSRITGETVVLFPANGSKLDPFSVKGFPAFFFYYGKSSMSLNRELIDSLEEKDVAHLSEVERRFFAYVKESGLLDIHSGSVIRRLSQEEECRAFLRLVDRK